MKRSKMAMAAKVDEKIQESEAESPGAYMPTQPTPMPPSKPQATKDKKIHAMP